MKLKVTSWNIWKGKHLTEIISFLRTSKPDIIGLQEVIEERINDSKKNTAELIAKELDYNFVYYKSFTNNRHEKVLDQGNAILSKYPIKKSRCHFLSDLDFYKNNAETEPRNLIETEIEFNNKTFNIFVTHLAYSHKFQDSQTRNYQVDKLLKFLTKKDTILLGDFNCEISSKEISLLLNVLKNADFKTPKVPTWTIFPYNYHGFIENELKHRIDNIFVTKEIKVSNFIIEDSKGSDHLPITAIIEI